MYVFVSHSRGNSNFAFRLCEELGKRNIQTWLDMRDLDPGAEWNQSVVEAIRAAVGFVFLIGPEGDADRYQSFEWQQVIGDEYYLDPSKPLIPVLIGNASVPGFLKARQRLQLKESHESFAEVANGIAQALANPAACVDESRLEVGRKARKQALESLRQYSQEIAEEDAKRAPTRIKD